MLGLGLVDILPNRAAHELEQQQRSRSPTDGDEQRLETEDGIVDDTLVQHGRKEIAADKGAKDAHADVFREQHDAFGAHKRAGKPSDNGADRAPDIRVDGVLQTLEQTALSDSFPVPLVAYLGATGLALV